MWGASGSGGGPPGHWGLFFVPGPTVSQPLWTVYDRFMTEETCTMPPDRAATARRVRMRNVARRREAAAAGLLLMSGWKIYPPENWDGQWPLEDESLVGAVR